MSNLAASVDPSPLDPHDNEATEVLAWAADTFADRLALVTGLGPQSVAILRLLEQIGRRVDVVLLDTGLLFDETLALATRLEARFGVAIRRVHPGLTVEAQAEAHSARLWQRDPDACCAVRKVEPLHRALQGHDAWISGLRTSQGPTRAAVQPVAHDPVTGKTKIAPLASWSRERLVRFLADEGLPYNPLLDRGYASIGCRPCTRATVSFTTARGFVDERAGRWADHPEKRECGLHVVPAEGVSR
jgi:phosphoadenosine phosphosulfate reductase